MLCRKFSRTVIDVSICNVLMGQAMVKGQHLLTNIFQLSCGVANKNNKNNNNNITNIYSCIYFVAVTFLQTSLYLILLICPEMLVHPWWY